MLPIDTTRLRLRPFTLEDLPAVVRLRDSCSGRAPVVEYAAWLDWTVRNYEGLRRLRQPPYGDYAIVLRRGSAVIGSIGLVPSYGPFETLPFFRARLREAADGRSTPEMGLYWAVEPDHRRAGYAAEAAAAFAAAVFRTLDAHRLVATTEHSNAASIGVMRRLGMAIERNPDPTPEWFQTVGVLLNPRPRPET